MDKVNLAQKCVLYNKENKKILILKRSDYKPHNAFQWDLFGGSVELGEHSEESLKREGIEEIGVKVNELQCIHFYSNPMDYDETHTFIFGLFVSGDFKFENGEPKLSPEHTEYKWISLDELDDYDFLMSVDKCKDKIKPFIERYSLNFSFPPIINFRWVRFLNI